MFRKRKPEPQAQQAAKAAVKLTAAEKREISRILETARGDGKVHSAQDTLPFRQMYPDGLCKLDDHTWSKCIEFEDSTSPTYILYFIVCTWNDLICTTHTFYNSLLCPALLD